MLPGCWRAVVPDRFVVEGRWSHYAINDDAIAFAPVTQPFNDGSKRGNLPPSG
jgi:hypothetical protein